VGGVVSLMALSMAPNYDGPLDACGSTVDSMLVHDCLLDTWGGLEIDHQLDESSRIRIFVRPCLVRLRV
jgi:hypothetical protein